MSLPHWTLSFYKDHQVFYRVPFVPTWWLGHLCQAISSDWATSSLCSSMKQGGNSLRLNFVAHVSVICKRLSVIHLQVFKLTRIRHVQLSHLLNWLFLCFLHSFYLCLTFSFFVFFNCMSLCGVFLYNIHGQSLVGVTQNAPTFRLTDFVAVGDSLEPNEMRLSRHRRHDDHNMMQSGSDRPVFICNRVAIRFHGIHGTCLSVFLLYCYLFVA